ncbi:MAG: hypothetical protein AABZ08_08550 [Planctomycetota bacterium]
MSFWTYARSHLIILPLCAAMMGGTCMVTGVPLDMPPANTQPDGMPSDGVISFANQIQPIFSANCAICHKPGGFADDQGITLYLTAGNAHGLLVNMPSDQDSTLTRVVPGNSAQSLLYLKISSDNPPVGIRMPFLRSPLSQSDINLIRDWIDQGALNN